MLNGSERMSGGVLGRCREEASEEEEEEEEEEAICM
jgi:hypothetical protein